ncbi:MAG: type VI secretion system tube protein TssD [Terracidiphilus sp.]|jgi:type VI secretion system secreted protein Hcp
MALNAYLMLTGTKQGTIKGSTAKGKRSDAIEISDFSFGIESPRDEHSGLPTGQRQHKPVVIVREVDEASPLLFQALCTNESFKSATLSFARASASGKPLPINTIELTNASISEIAHAQNSGGKRRERVTVQYDTLLVNGLSDVVLHSI